MKLFIDCEWSGFGGDLISMALVPETPSIEPFYEVREWRNMDLHPWVMKNVIPVLYREPMSGQFSTRLAQYLNQFDDIQLIADWPEDLMWFCKMLITGPGYCVRIPPVNMTYVDLSYESDIPHNALEDAIALKRSYIQQ